MDQRQRVGALLDRKGLYARLIGRENVAYFGRCEDSLAQSWRGTWCVRWQPLGFSRWPADERSSSGLERNAECRIQNADTETFCILKFSVTRRTYYCAVFVVFPNSRIVLSASRSSRFGSLTTLHSFPNTIVG
jgi:hypothetical protein